MLSAKAIINLQKLVRSVPVGDYVIEYVVAAGAGDPARRIRRRRISSRRWSIGAPGRVPGSS